VREEVSLSVLSIYRSHGGS